MSRFRFRSVDGEDITPKEWLHVWAALFPSKKYYAEEYDALIANYKSLSAVDFERIGKAIARLLNCSVPNEIPWYLDSYCPLIKEIAALSGTEDLRTVDKALFSYGGNLQFPN